VPNLTSLFLRLRRTNESLLIRGFCEGFVTWKILRWGAVSTFPNLQAGGPLFSAVRYCLFHALTATLHIRDRFSFRNLRTRHAMVTGTNLSQLWKLYRRQISKQMLDESCVRSWTGFVRPKTGTCFEAKKNSVSSPRASWLQFRDVCFSVLKMKWQQKSVKRPRTWYMAQLLGEELTAASKYRLQNRVSNHTSWQPRVRGTKYQVQSIILLPRI
jgi:hypothetical protein